jgi:hypothetical protein
MGCAPHTARRPRLRHLPLLGAFSACADPAEPAPLLVAPDDAVRRLREFVEYERSLPSPSASGAGVGTGTGGGRNGSGGGGGAGGGTGGGGGGGGAGARRASLVAGGPPGAARGGLVPRRVAEREREFWARLPQVRRWGAAHCRRARAPTGLQRASSPLRPPAPQNASPPAPRPSATPSGARGARSRLSWGGTTGC